MNNKENFQRANRVIQSDKSIMSEGCKALVLNDFAKMFDEYFELSNLPNLEISCEKGVYNINITFQANRVKKFNVLK